MMPADKLSMFLSMWNPGAVDDLGTNFPKCLRNSRLIGLFFRRNMIFHCLLNREDS